MSVFEGPLGMLPAGDTKHRDKYPLTAMTAPTLPTPCVIGINWHVSFDQPEEMRDGARTIRVVGRGDLGRKRGGHCTFLPSVGFRDPLGWYGYYDQGKEGACVGFAVARMLSHLNRNRYDAFDLYHRAQLIDEWPGEGYEGTSVRAGLDVVREEGPRRVLRTTTYAPDLGHGILANRWILDAADLYAVLGWSTSNQLIPFLNSWGTRYSHVTYFPIDVLSRLLFEEGGDCATVTDR